MFKKKPKNFILDVDGVLTTGIQGYSEKGKIIKFFGPHDHDGLKLLKDKIKITFITADKKGYKISKKRIVDDMGFDLKLVSEHDRFSYIDSKYAKKDVVYMGDGIYDAEIIQKSLFGIAPNNAREEAKKVADYVTKSNSGEGAVLDASLKILKLFFKK
ncbi:HAD hydrolase family protein [Pelagibacterales bacterium SAG-MED21]|nr:HAD hydrolase family protein [Pelagibacterales bacterium SAG-MED21]